ncbi:cation transporter [Caenispirillum bisanense]|uniref:cation transporter n=1 Tax=Caenispirillum bisanense TaxID=414052 RepID=UPI0031E399EC
MSGCGCGSVCPTTARRNAAFRRVLWIVLALNAVMFLVEGIAGWLGRSAALQGDSLDFLGDAANYGIALFVLGRSVTWKAGSALVKGLTMAAFGVFVLAMVGWRAMTGTVPEPLVMGGIGFLALAVNVAAALLLYRYREGDANMRSVWICSRNDAMANVAVIVAGGVVIATGQGWADWLVGLFIAGLSLQGAHSIIRHASRELKDARAGLTPASPVA